MKLSILAARRQRAIERIMAAVGLDLSVSALPKSPDVQHRELHLLEAVAEHMEVQQPPEAPDTEAILEKISAVDGVGPKTMDAIRAAVTSED